MTEYRTADVWLKDLCDFSRAVSRLMYDLDRGDRDDCRDDIKVAHAIVETWAADKTVMGGGCHPDHRCSPCRNLPDPAFLRRQRRMAERQAIARGDLDGMRTPGLSAPPEIGRESTYTRWDAEFVLKHVSEAVIEVTCCGRTAYFGLCADARNPNYPYASTTNDHEVEATGIIGPGIHNFPTPKAALDSACGMLLGLSSEEDEPYGMGNVFSRDEAPVHSNGQDASLGTMSERRLISVPLQDLCAIADAMATIQHDLDNGKWKYVDIEITGTHRIVEDWARDPFVLGDAGCHEHHGCRLCRDFPVLAGALPGWSRQADPPKSDDSPSQDSQPPDTT